jgi:hypothetical protein
MKLTDCHAELVSASYFSSSQIKTLKRVQGDDAGGTLI